MGTPAFAVPTLAAVQGSFDVVAVATRPDKGRGRGRAKSYSEVKERALAAGLPVEQPATLRDAEVQERLAAYEPDVIVVAAYGLILPAEVLGMPPMGCVNVHASLLPRHRGAAPIAWAILRGDEKTGITTMLMDEGLDTGPMLLRRSIPLSGDDTTESLTPRLAAIGAELLVETLEGMRDGTITPRPQPEQGVTLAPSFKKQDGAVDWHAAAVAIDRQVRALQPWPGTFTFRDDERLLLWRVRAHEVEASEPPGTVLAVSDDAIRVACGRGTLDILELQRAGGRRQPAADYLRGRPLAAGERLAPRGD
jgi:methionyl-tRNA formyltransferase